MKVWRRLARLVPILGAMMLLLAGCGQENLSALQPKGPVAREQLSLIMLSLGVMVFVFVVVMVIYVYVLVKFRKRKGDDSIPKQVEGNHVLEIVWTVIPILLLIVIAVPTIYYTFRHSENYLNDKNAIQVKVTGHQFWWEFQYKDNEIVTSNDLIIPVGKRVVFEITASDVNHSFWVPALAGKIDANVGSNMNTLWLEAEEPGTYKGKCAELCGFSHALMEFKVIALEEAEYEAWVDKMLTPNAVVSDVQAGEKVFKDNCMSCHATDPTTRALGPNLNNFAERTKIAGVLDHDDENLRNWIINPQGEKPGALMPSFESLEDQQVDDLIQYLNALK